MQPNASQFQKVDAVLKEAETVEYPYVTSREVARRIHVERAITRAFVETVLACATPYSMRVHDGEEYATGKTRDAEEIMKALGSTDSDTIYVYDGKRSVGFLLLIYGNSGWDVISDHTATDEFDRIVADASALAEAFSQRIH